MSHITAGKNILRARAALPLALLLAACASTPTPQRAPPPAVAASRVPALEDMLPATSSAKMGVPVELRYSFDASVQTGQAVTLYLAAIPQVAGNNLSVSLKTHPGIRATTGEIHEQKATASAAYRQQVSITRLAGGPSELRVLVTMDMPIGSAFGYYSIPLDGAPPAAKKAVDRTD